MKYQRLMMGLVLCLPLCASAQKGIRCDIKGHVKDMESGEALPYANVMISDVNRGVATNSDGYFVLVDIPPSEYTLTVRYIGYEPYSFLVRCVPDEEQTLTIEMKPTVIEIDGVIITAQAEMLETSTREVSQITLSPRQLATLPSIGEVDVFRTMQLLPGISGASEGESGLYVRGGTPDQNLVLFDGMTIYHVDHFFGFFSAFNADAVKDIQMFKGGFPAEYGGRISSVINLTGKTGNRNKLRLGLGANLLSGHGVFELPISKQATFLFACRRSYTDFIQSGLYGDIYNLMTGEDAGLGTAGGGVRGGGMQGGFQTAEFMPVFYFYDLNSKFTYEPSDRDILTASFYSGKDDLDKSQDFSGMKMFGDTGEEIDMETTDYSRWGNTGFSGEWSRQWSNRLHMDMLVAWSEYFSQYDRSSSMTEMFSDDSMAVSRGLATATEEDNKVRDVTFRMDIAWHAARSHTLKSGLWLTNFESRFESTLNDTTGVLDRNDQAVLAAGYVQDRWRMGDGELTLGMRGSYYQETGNLYLEPRASFTYSLNRDLTLKGAWGHYYQFVNRITNEDVLQGSRDFWILADESLKPSFAAHYILGVGYEKNGYYLGVEAYLKDLDNILEYTRRYTGRFEGTDYFYSGTGKAKGIEFLVQNKKGALTGWIGYTLGRVDHQFAVFNDGDPFPADNDRRHEVNAVVKWNVGKWTFAVTGVFATGNAYTAPESQYFVTMLNGDVYSYVHVSDKNANRMPDYQRIDISASHTFEGDSWITEVGVSVFNLLNHKNVWYREYNLDTVPVTVTDALMLGFTPTVYIQFNLR